MTLPSNPIGIRATPLVDTGSDTHCLVVHRRDLVFDVNALSRQEHRRWRVVPTETAAGVAWSDLADWGELLVDTSVLSGPPAIATDYNAVSVTIDPACLRHARQISVCGPLQRLLTEATSAQRIDGAITTFTGKRIRQRLDETLEIPPLPAAAQRIIALKSDPDYALADLVKVVETDPSIAARIMSWARSAFYSADPPPRSLSDAIMRVLGFDIVMNLALGLCLGGTLRLPARHVTGMPPFWTEAVFTAAAMEALSLRQTGGRDHAGIHYLTGLLASFGTLVLGHVFPPQYEALCHLQEANPDFPAHQLDEHVLSLPRELLAAELFELWGLPPETVTAVREQNRRDYLGEHQPTVRLLQTVQATVRSMLGHGSQTPLITGPVDLKTIGIGERDLHEVSSLLEDSRDALEGLARAVA